MSFGFSAGDFIAVIQLAGKLRKTFVSCPSQLKAISDEVRSLSIILQDAEVAASEGKLSSKQHTEIQDILHSCRNVLSELEATLDRYLELNSSGGKLGSQLKRAWRRMNWEPDDIRDLRSRIISNIGLLQGFLAHISSEAISEVKKGVDLLTQRQADEDRLSILNWLAPADFVAQQHDFFGRWQEGTGQWLLDSPEYKSWVQTAGATLFCPGIPGAGKTILTSVVVDNLTNTYRACRSIGIAYIYCDFRRQGEQTVDYLLCALLRQLADTSNPLSLAVIELFEKYKKDHARPLRHEVLKSLRNVVSACTKTFIIVDALDECSTSLGCRTRLISEVARLQKDLKINIFATSRFIPEITDNFAGSTWLEIRASKEDVRNYLNSRIIELPAFVRRDPSLQDEVLQGLVDASDGMFLLAQLHIDSMKGKKSPKAIRTALLNLSTGSEAYDEAYDKAMERINSQALDEEKLAKQALSWITCAKRPLSSLELQHALAVEIGEAALDEDNISMVDDIVSVCAGLVTVDEESRMIRLVHHTTQDYFVRKRSIWFPNAEAEIAAVCLSYISFEDFESGPCPTDEEFAKRMHSHPLYKYAACNWGHHARAAGSTVQNIDSFVRSEVQLDAAFQALTMTDLEHEYPEYSQMFPKAMTSLHLVAYFGLQAPSSQLAKKEVLDLPNSRGLTPMSIAASRGHIDTVRLLLEHGADLSATDDNGSTPLTWAAEKGHENIARLLLENGADVDAKDNYGQTPLCLAASYGEEEVAKLLLKNGADVDTRDERGQTPLCLAASYGEEGMVRLLLENGADIESKDESGQGPLCLAAMHENEAIAKLLIKNKARIDTTDEHGQTPLHVTVSYGEKDMVKLLLRKGANINATDEHNQTSLHLAVLNAQGDIIKLLIQNGADANAVDEYGRTPLVLAALLGQKDIVKLFFEQRT